MHARKTSGSLFQQSQFTSQCPLCNASAYPLEAHVVEERKEKNLLHIRCRSCENSLLALVYVRPDGIFSVGVPTDCSSEDANRFHEAEPILSDDVLNIHVELGDTERFLKALQK